MGQSAVCRIEVGGRSFEGTALRETDELLVRGEVRLRIPYGEMTAVEAGDGRLSVTWPGGAVVLHLGAQAERWADRIRNPRTLLDKLGVKPGVRVSLVGIDDPSFVKLLYQRTEDVTHGSRPPATGSDLIFLRADTARDLKALSRLRRALAPKGGIWAVSPKGDPTIRDVDVIEAAKGAGLVDVKVVRWSDTHTALKLVIPVAQR